MNKKSLFKNSIYNVIYKTLNIVFPLITSVYVARILMADSIGKVAAAQNVVSYFTMIASMGIPTYGVKLIAQFKVKSEESSKSFSELFWINFVITIICSISFVLLMLFCPYFRGKRLVYYITGLNIVFNILNVDWFYQGIQEYGYIALRSFIIKIFSLISLVIFVRCSDDYLIYALINSLALGGNYLFNVLRLKKYIKLTIRNIDLKKHIKPITTLFIATIAAEVYVLADTTMLDVFCDSKIVGYYTMSMRIIKIIRGLVVAVAAVFLPQMSYYYNNNQKEKFFELSNKGLHILSVLSVPVAAGIFLVSNDAILVFFGSGFKESIQTTRILSMSVVTVAFSNFIGMQMLVTIGKEKITTISTICGACINIILNYFLIKLLQQNGAAIASIITEGFVMVVQIFLARKYLKFQFGMKTIIAPVIGMIVSVILIKMLISQIILRLIVCCFVGAIVYFVIAIICKDSFVVGMWNAIKLKIK